VGAAERRPRLAMVGPLLGSRPGWVPNPAEVAGRLFEREGYTVRYTSAYPQRLLRLADMLRAILAWRREVDLYLLAVYSGPAFWMADLPSRLIRALGKKQVLILHGGNLPEFSRRYPDRVRRVLDRADAIVSPSGFLAHHFQGWGCPVEVIPNVLRVEDYPFCCRRQVQPNLIWMRTFEDIYNPGLAVRALAELCRSYPQARLTMAGQDRGELAATKALAERLGVGECVRFAGFLDARGKQEQFAAHDIYLNTNRVDNMPVSVLEAAAFGLPVVATRVGGIPFLLEDGQTGLLVPDDDAGAMTEAVRRLVEEPELAERLSTGGRRLAESCAWPEVRRRWEQLFSRLGWPAASG